MPNLSPVTRALLRGKPAILEAAVFAGLALAAYGVAAIYTPAGLIVGGALLAAVAFLELRS